MSRDLDDARNKARRNKSDAAAARSTAAPPATANPSRPAPPSSANALLDIPAVARSVAPAAECARNNRAIAQTSETDPTPQSARYATNASPDGISQTSYWTATPSPATATTLHNEAR